VMPRTLAFTIEAGNRPVTPASITAASWRSASSRDWSWPSSPGSTRGAGGAAPAAPHWPRCPAAASTHGAGGPAGEDRGASTSTARRPPTAPTHWAHGTRPPSTAGLFGPSVLAFLYHARPRSCQPNPCIQALRGIPTTAHEMEPWPARNLRPPPPSGAAGAGAAWRGVGCVVANEGRGPSVRDLIGDLCAHGEPRTSRVRGQGAQAAWHGVVASGQRRGAAPRALAGVVAGLDVGVRAVPAQGPGFAVTPPTR
jgi:hypothetical protein